MTSSETRTESRQQARNKHKSHKGGKRKGPASSGAPHSAPSGEDRDSQETTSQPSGARSGGLPTPILWGGLVLLLLGGWLAILQINRWHFGPPVFFLCTGWLAVLLTGRFLWTAGMAAAEADDTAAEAEFWRPEGPRDELLREKRALLKAIKEIEFDHQMGKMSDTDATELSTFYRSRAIEIIKALERSGDNGRELSMAERIERELKARMSVQQFKAKAKSKAEAEGGGRRAADPESAATGASGAANTAAADADDGRSDTTDEGDGRMGDTENQGDADVDDAGASPEAAERDAGTADASAADADADADADEAPELPEQRVKAEVGS